MANQIQPSDGGVIDYEQYPVVPLCGISQSAGRSSLSAGSTRPTFLSNLYGGETRMERNILPRSQIRKSGFVESQYKFNQQCGVFVATIDRKQWERRKKLTTYMTFEDGRKVIAQTWQRSKYEGLAKMEVGCRIRVTYDKNRAGTLCVRRVERLSDHNEQKVLCSIMMPKGRL